MSRKRYISTDMSKSGKLEELARRAGDYGVLLFTWMIPHFDDWGRMEGEPDKVFFEVTPRFAMLGKTPEDAERAIAAMHDIGLITWYEVDGNRYIQANLDTFYSLQTYIPKAKRAEDKSHYPPPPAEPNDGVAQNSTPQQPVAQNSTESRKVAQNTPSPFSLHPSPSDDDKARAREREEWSRLVTFIYGMPDAYAADELNSYVEDLGEDVVLEAMRRTVDKNPRSPRDYFVKICNGWMSEKVRSLDDVRRLDDHFERTKRKQNPHRAPPPTYEEPSQVDHVLRSLKRQLAEITQTGAG